MMADTLIWLVTLPLAGAVATLLLPRQGNTIANLSAVATAIAAGVLVHAAGGEGALHYAIGGWQAGLGIAMRADGLSALL
jgi:formate hydrogenlyase subunit 3/multisubunit Na+/H+ antiporter MnhD subunit